MVIIDIPEEFYITGLTNNIDLLDRIVVMADEVTWLRWQYQRQQYHKNNGMFDQYSNDFGTNSMNRSNRKRSNNNNSNNIPNKSKSAVIVRTPKTTPPPVQDNNRRPVQNVQRGVATDTTTPAFKRRRKSQIPQRTSTNQQYYVTDELIELDGGYQGDSSPSVVHSSDSGVDNLKIIASSVRTCADELDRRSEEPRDDLEPAAAAEDESSIPADDSTSQHSDESGLVVAETSNSSVVQQEALAAATPVVVKEEDIFKESDVIKAMLNMSESDLNGNESMDYSNQIGGDPSMLMNNCLECGRIFESANSLYAHMKSHALNRPFECPICNKTFTQASSLNRHKQIHTGERPFQCPECGKGFSRRYQLNNHFELAHKDVILVDDALNVTSDSNKSPQSS
ncbi:uncharacterized protein LOC141911355 [Tubulanus polymorphus]|uniref:uncharacterized protein LOC141911355 n=1 Tax=Tubulanus polymorphus TaxID=672921 RepID=UPI003DA27A10